MPQLLYLVGMRTQLKYLNGIEFLRQKLIDNKVTLFFDNRIQGDDLRITPTTGSTIHILGLVIQNTDDMGDTDVRISVRLVNPDEDRGEQEIERITLQPKEIAVRYYPSLRIVGNDNRTFTVDTNNEDLSISLWFYTENTTNEADSNRES